MSLSLLVGVVAASAVATATDQTPIINISSGSISDRLMQIETAVNSQGQLLYQIQQQLSDAQREIDTLRGQLQENQYHLSQVIERQKDLYTQLDLLTSNSNKIKENTNSTNNTVPRLINQQMKMADYEVNTILALFLL
ncbi:MAG: YbgF trimerization domain-containing protein [Arsenophonus sp. NEOnobi-MAG3]